MDEINALMHGFSVAASWHNAGLMIFGILLGIVSIFPHYLCYLPAMILLLRWCEDMHRSIYFYHHTTGQGKKSLPGRLGKLALIWIALVFGCLLECFVNPALLKGFLQFF